MARINYFKEPKKKMSQYKSKASYLRAIYRANKDVIDALYEERVLKTKAKTGVKSAYKMFKNQLIAGDETWGSLSRADIRAKVNRLSKTKNYFLAEARIDQMKKNMFKGDKAARNYVRKQLGWNKALDWSKVKYHGDRKDKDNRYYYIENEKGEIVVAWKSTYAPNGKRDDSPHKLILFVALNEYGDVMATYRPEEFGDFDIVD